MWRPPGRASTRERAIRRHPRDESRFEQVPHFTILVDELPRIVLALSLTAAWIASSHRMSGASPPPRAYGAIQCRGAALARAAALANFGQSSSNRGKHLPTRRDSLTCIIFVRCSSPAVHGRIPLAHAKDAQRERCKLLKFAYELPLVRHNGAVAKKTALALATTCEFHVLVCLHVYLGSRNSHGRRRVALRHCPEFLMYRRRDWSCRRTCSHLHSASFSSRPTYFATSINSQVIPVSYSGLRAVSHVPPAQAVKSKQPRLTATPMPRDSQITCSGANTSSSSTHRNTMGLKLQPCRNPTVGVSVRPHARTASSLLRCIVHSWPLRALELLGAPWHSRMLGGAPSRTPVRSIYDKETA